MCDVCEMRALRPEEKSEPSPARPAREGSELWWERAPGEPCPRSKRRGPRAPIELCQREAGHGGCCAFQTVRFTVANRYRYPHPRRGRELHYA